MYFLNFKFILGCLYNMFICFWKDFMFFDENMFK